MRTLVSSILLLEDKNERDYTPVLAPALVSSHLAKKPSGPYKRAQRRAPRTSRLLHFKLGSKPSEADRSTPSPPPLPPAPSVVPSRY